MSFEIIGEITEMEIIATGAGVRILRYLRKSYGHGHWRKLKGNATVRLSNGAVRRVELHWYVRLTAEASET